MAASRKQSTHPRRKRWASSRCSRPTSAPSMVFPAPRSSIWSRAPAPTSSTAQRTTFSATRSWTPTTGLPTTMAGASRRCAATTMADPSAVRLSATRPSSSSIGTACGKPRSPVLRPACPRTECARATLAMCAPSRAANLTTQAVAVWIADRSGIRTRAYTIPPRLVRCAPPLSLTTT